MTLRLGALFLAGLAWAAPPGAAAGGAAPLQSDTLPTFRHAEHESVACASCHTMDPDHGATPVRTLQDCRSCHHTEEARMECAGCHAGAEIREAVHALPRSLALSVGESPFERELPFRHGEHEEVACADCHAAGPAEGPSLGAAEVECASCHQEHHEAETACLDCHLQPAVDSHAREAHATCSGAGCHADVPVEIADRSRASCLWCHQDQADHEPGDPCAACHLVPAARPGVGGAGR